jgi:hypothetical protein
LAGAYYKGDVLHVHVIAQPKASKSEIVDWQEDELKVRLAAPPVDGAANTALIEAFAKWCKVRKSAISLINGQTSRHKHLAIDSPTQVPEVITQRLNVL